MKNLLIIPILVIVSCTSQSLEDIQPDCSENPIMINISSEKSGCGLNNGSAMISVTGGTSPFAYNIGNGVQTDDKFDNLAPGSYSVTVTDANNCSEVVEFTIENNDGTTATATSTNSGCGESLAIITVEAANGVEPYSYSLNGGLEQPENVFESVGSGLHQIIISDVNGCEFTLDHFILAGTSYDQEVKPLIMNNCAVTGCHSGSQSPNFSVFSNVQNNADKIRTRTQNGSMPPGGRTLTQEEINLIACWVDDGAQNN